MLNYFNNRYRQKGFLNGVKGEFALAALKNLNPESPYHSVQALLGKAEEFLCQEDVPGLFDTACFTNNTAVVRFALDMHEQNLNLMEQGKFPEDEKKLPLLLSAETVTDGLMTAIEHGNFGIVKELTERVDEWVYCQTDPEQFADLTSDEYWDIQFYSPMIYALRQMERHEETPDALKTQAYLKEKYGIEAGKDFMPLHDEIETKPELTLIKGGITSEKPKADGDKPKKRPAYIKPVKP